VLAETLSAMRAAIDQQAVRDRVGN
jgi:hypothetical protein